MACGQHPKRAGVYPRPLIVTHILGSDPHAFSHFWDERKQRRNQKLYEDNSEVNTNFSLFSSPSKSLASIDSGRMGTSMASLCKIDDCLEQTGQGEKFNGGACAHVYKGCMEEPPHGFLRNYTQTRSIMKTDTYLQAVLSCKSMEDEFFGDHFGVESKDAGKSLGQKSSFISSFLGKTFK